MPTTHDLAFNPEALTLHLHWLTLRYGVDVRLQIANLRARYGDQKGDRIRLSRYISSDDQAIETLRHEYAHAVAELKHGSKAGHGRLWRRLAAEMGARPRSCGQGPLLAVPLLEPSCAACGHTHSPTARRSRRARCRACRSPRLEWRPVVATRFA
jgi:predicted SprT family Zn-dependent metalloprotease